jgi:hypothetical protein
MKRVPTEELVTLLARDLVPTGRIPRLRAQLALLLAAGALMLLLVVGYRGLRPSAFALLLSGEAFTLVTAGLILSAGGAGAAALAMTRPGRELLARGGLGLGLGGLALSVVVGALCFGGAPSAIGEARALGAALSCGISGILFTLPLCLLCAFLLSTGTPRHLGLAASVAAFGATAFGALAVHFTCPSPSVWHWIIGHALAPALGAILLALPVRALARRWEYAR